MKDLSGTNQELLEENALLKQRIQEMELPDLERKQAEERLLESKAEFGTIFEVASVGIVQVNPLTGRILRCNETYCRITGYSLSELMEVSFPELTHPEDRQRDWEIFSRAARGEMPVYFNEKRYIRKDRSIIWVRLNAGFVRDSNDEPIRTVAICEDITDRKRAEEELLESENRLSSIVQGFSIPAFVIGKDHNVLYWNRALEKLSNIPAAEVIGTNQHWRAFYAHESPCMADLLVDEVIDNSPQWCEGKYIKSILIDGAYEATDFFPALGKKGRWLHFTAAAVRDSHGNLLGAVETLEDVTNRKHAEEQLHHTLDSLRKAFGTTVQVLISAVETRDPYTAGHQIRSADLARAIATEMNLPQDKIEAIRMAGPIHDIGKLSVPAELLSKPTKLTEIEFGLIKEHANKGLEMLKDVESPWPLAEIVYQHHERMDGSGYPRHLKGEEIIMEARILAVADVVESMASHRPYRPALGLNAALAEIENNRGTLYDADAVDACLRLFRGKRYQLQLYGKGQDHQF